MEEGRAAPDGWHRTGIRRSINASFALLAALVLVIAALAELQADDRVGGLALSVAALGCAFTAVRVLREGLLLSRDGVVIRNDFKTYVIGWKEIESFYVPQGSTLLHVRLASGEVIRVLGVAGLRPSLFHQESMKYADLTRRFNERLSQESRSDE
jgi:hypothetical protein